jgi:hypothetical protein
MAKLGQLWPRAAAVGLIMIMVTDAFKAPALPLQLGRGRAAASPLRRPALLMQARHGDAEDATASSARRALILQTAAAASSLLAADTSALAADGKGEVVLVVGATGGIGQYATFNLLQRGYKVRGVTRRDKDPKFLNQIKGTYLEEVEWVHGDLNDKASLAPAVRGAKKIIFCAGRLSEQAH